MTPFDSEPALRVIMYHYVCDLARSPYPQLKAMALDDFRAQLANLRARYEMATLESAMAFLGGAYRPVRDLCLLTFDDGLKEHYRDVTPLLAECGVQGLFFVISGCVEERRVAPVHMNHFLMAALGFRSYSSSFFEKLEERAPGSAARRNGFTAAQGCYPWDSPEVASFKYLFNFVLDPGPRDEAVREMFEEHVGPEAQFARELYITWEEAREMQSEGMLIGGHTHGHRPLSGLSPEDRRRDLALCRALLAQNLAPQDAWPFSYPYGKASSFSHETVAELVRLDFTAAFSTESGVNRRGASLYAIRRLDCKKATVETGAIQGGTA